MYFIPRNNRIYSFLVSIPQHIWYIFTAGIGIGLAIAWWLSMHRPLEQKVVQTKGVYEELTNQQFHLLKTQQELTSLQTEVENLGQVITLKSKEKGSAKSTLHKLIADVVENNVSLISCVPGDIKKKNGYTTQRVELHLNGAFTTLQKFFNYVATKEYGMRIKRISLHKGEKDSLDARCQITLIEVIHETQQTM